MTNGTNVLKIVDDLEFRWKDIIGYEGIYQANKKGEIRKLPSKNIINQVYAKGYLNVFLLDKEGVQKRHQVHRVVAYTFIPNPENKPQVNHINGIKNCNVSGNLEWATAKENTNHAIRTRLMPVGCERSDSIFNKTQLEFIRQALEKGIKTSLIADSFGVSRSAIFNIKEGKSYKSEQRLEVARIVQQPRKTQSVEIRSQAVRCATLFD